MINHITCNIRVQQIRSVKLFWSILLIYFDSTWLVGKTGRKNLYVVIKNDKKSVLVL